MADVSALLLELVDAPKDVLDDWRTWFDTVCLPSRVAVPGVRAGRRAAGYQNPGQQAIADADPLDVCLFELDSPDVVESSEWAKAEEALAGPWLEKHRQFADSTLFRQIVATVDDYMPPALSEAELLHGAFYEMPTEHHDEFNDWYNTEHIPIQMTVPGYLNARRFQGVVDPERFVALYDVVSVADTRTPEAKGAMESAWSDRVRDKLARARARRLFLFQALETEARD